MKTIYTLFVLVSALVTFTVPARAQSPEEDRAVLDIPDSLVIQGLMRYEQQTLGAKQPTYYGMAFPVLRRDGVHGITNVTTLPAISAKQTYPTPVHHGRLRVSSADITAQHYGNLTLAGRTTVDWKDILISADGSIGGGRAHLSDAAWHRETANVRARQVLDWRTAYDAQLSLNAGRTGVYDSASTGSHRTFYQVRGQCELDRTLGTDNQLRLIVDAAQRGVSGPETGPSEQVVSGHVSWEKASGRFWLTTYGHYEMVRTSRSVGTEGTATTFAGGAQAWIRPDEAFGGALGMDLYSINYMAGDSLNEIRPSVTVWARLFRRVKFTGTVSSGADRMGIYDAYTRNNMLNLSTPLKTVFNSFDLDLNAQATINDQSVLTVGAHQATLTNYPVWRRQAVGESGNEPGQFILDYDWAAGEDATINSIYARYNQNWNRGSLDAFATVRMHDIGGRDVPHVPDWEGHVATHIPVSSDVLISPSLDIVGPRAYVVPGSAAMGELGMYFAANLGVSVPVLRQWMLTLSLQNLAHQQYNCWEDVKEPGFHLQISMKRDI